MRRRRFSRRRYGRRRSFRRSSASYKRTRRIVKRTVYSMAETKNCNVAIASTVNDSLWGLYMMPNIPQGPGDNERIGNKLMTRWWTVNLTIHGQFSTTFAAGPLELRLYIVWPTSKSITDIDQMLTTQNFPLTGLPDQDNWIFWKDLKFNMGPGGNTAEPRIKLIKMYKRFSYKAEFESANELRPTKAPLLVISSNTVATQRWFDVVGYVKISYKDV